LLTLRFEIYLGLSSPSLMNKIIIALLLVVSVCSCSPDYENEYVVDYFIDLSEFPSDKTKVFKDLHSANYFFYDIGKFVVGKDTMLTQVSYDTEFKYDSSVSILQNKAINLKEAYSFKMDSSHGIEKIEILKFPYNKAKLTDKKEYSNVVKMNEDELLYSNVITKFKGFDSVKVKNNTYQCAVMVSYGVFKINEDIVANPTDTFYLKKYFGMVKNNVNFYDEPRVYVLDTVIDTDKFNLQDYTN